MAPDIRLACGTKLALEASAATVTGRRTPEELADIVEALASRPDEWMGQVRLRADRRWYKQLYHGQDYDVWLISWLPLQSTGFHDHGESAGAFVVAVGLLEEHRPGEQCRGLLASRSRAFGPNYTHDVRNVSLAPAISIHAYSPPLTEMNEYELDGSRVVPRSRAHRPAKTVDPDWRTQTQARGSARRAARRTGAGGGACPAATTIPTGRLRGSGHGWGGARRYSSRGPAQA